MKKTYLLFILLYLISCSDKDNITIDEPLTPLIEVQVFYTDDDNNDLKYDIGSDIYIYYNINIPDALSRYTYIGNGHYQKDSSIVSPDRTYKIAQEGKTVIRVEDGNVDKEFTLVAESNFYKNMRIYSYHPYCRDTIKELYIFSP